MRFRLALGLLVLIACKSPDATEQKKLLSSPDPKQREKAAETLQSLFKKDPKAVGDVPITEWEGRVNALPTASQEEKEKLLAQPLTPKSITDYRLDDFWVFTVKRDNEQVIVGTTSLRHEVAFFDVKPPDGFTGAWTTYYAHGFPHETDDYAAGKLTHMREFYDDGKLRREADMVEGKKPASAVMNGLVVTKYPDGKNQYEETYDKGVLNGPRKVYYRSGKLNQEGTFVKGELNGLLRSYREDGSDEWCILYDKGREVDRVCPKK